MAAVESYLRRNVIPHSSYETLVTTIHSAKFENAAFGDSRVASGVIGSARLANFAYPSENLTTILDIIDFYRRTGPLRKVVLQADPHQFSPYRLNADQRDLVNDLLKTSRPALQIMRAPYRQYLFEFGKAMVRTMQHRDRAEAAPPPKPDIIRFSDKSPDSQVREARIRVNQQAPIAGFRKTKAARQLERSLADLATAGIDVCLVIFPVSRAYRDSAAQQPEFAAVRQYYRETARKTGARLVDYWQTYDDRLFGNIDHLNEDGARLLTEAIHRDCHVARI